tara:strand:+ start:1283 stop:1714 length:432 start_codon:yes stop_codon:yes gene_type:complete
MLDKLKFFLSEIKPKKGTYLVSAFLMDNNWKIDFYSKEDHKIYTYTKKDSEIVMQEDNIFQKEAKVLEELDLEKVKVGYETAAKNIKEVRDKVLTILQVIDNIIVWNFTVLTPTLEVYNLRVNAETGDIVSEHKESVMNFRAK